jgi:hypothetical protein
MGPGTYGSKRGRPPKKKMPKFSGGGSYDGEKTAKKKTKSKTKRA